MNDQQLDLLGNSRCRIRRMNFSAAVTPTGPVARSVIVATVPPSARERDDDGGWRIFAHHLPRLVAALELAGVMIDDEQTEGAA